MVRITVPRASALQTALGNSAREALVTLAKAIADEIEATPERAERLRLISTFVRITSQIHLMDIAGVREARQHARATAAIDWMARRDQERALIAAQRAAEKIAREQLGKPMTSSVIDELRVARDRKAMP